MSLKIASQKLTATLLNYFQHKQSMWNNFQENFGNQMKFLEIFLVIKKADYLFISHLNCLFIFMIFI